MVEGLERGPLSGAMLLASFFLPALASEQNCPVDESMTVTFARFRSSPGLPGDEFKA